MFGDLFRYSSFSFCHMSFQHGIIMNADDDRKREEAAMKGERGVCGAAVKTHAKDSGVQRKR